QLALMLVEKSAHGVWVALREFTKRPRHRFDNHIVPITCQRVAQFESALRITAAAASFDVQSHSADQSCTAEPSIPASRPVVDQFVGKLMLATGRSSEIASEHINRTPTIDSAAEQSYIF